MPSNVKLVNFIFRQSWWTKGAVIVVIAAGCYFLLGRSKSVSSGTTFVARRGTLDIKVLQGGSLEALESQDIKCEVRGYQGVKILKIVEEGYQVTEDDVKTNKVLVELDSSEIRKQITQQDIQFESTVASLTEARQAYDIQLNQNMSDVKAAEQKAKFARMDLEKFMGDRAAKEITGLLGLLEEPAPDETNQMMRAASAVADPAPTAANLPPDNARIPSLVQMADTPATFEVKLAGGVKTASPPRTANSPAQPEAKPVPQPDASAIPPETNTLAAPPPKRVVIDFAGFADPELLGDGEAKQKIRKFEEDLQMAQKEYGQDKIKWEGTKRLFDKQFVTKTELEADEFKLENSRLKVQTTETARALFRKYEFPKSAEEFTSKCEEAVRELARARKGAVSKLAQAEAKLKSAEGRYNLELRQRKDLNDQLEKCMIAAKKVGLVVYGGRNRYYYYPQEQIREGALVREQQPIVTIPDMTKMAMKVRIHESHIKKVKKGQKTRITLDAFPDKALNGEVTKVGLLPDSQNEWMNPDMKVYLTTITITGVHDSLKPGMSGKVEILVNQLSGVVYVPIQAVTPSAGKHFCYVARGARQERREVVIGDFNDEFIEIKTGIKEGEKVCLRAPEGAEETDKDKAANKDKEKKPEEKPPPAPPPQAANGPA